MGTKIAVAFANIFVVEIETQIQEKSNVKPLDCLMLHGQQNLPVAHQQRGQFIPVHSTISNLWLKYHVQKQHT